MKSTTKKILTAVVAVTLLMAISAPAMAADDDDFTYLCLGDSIAAGTSLMGDGSEYTVDKFADACSGYGYISVPTAYHSLVRDGLSARLGEEVTLIQGARAAMRTAELRCLLGGGYNDYNEEYPWFYSWAWSVPAGNEWSNWGWGYMDYPTQENFQRTFETLLEQKSDVASYVEAIKKADVISLNFGSNDVFSSMMITGIFTNLELLLGEPAGSPVIDKLIEVVKNEGLSSALSIINKIYGTVININDFLRLVLEEADKTMETFKENYAWCVNKIFELNPDAVVVGIGVYNPLNFATISDEIAIDVSAVLALLTSEINNFVRSFSLKYKNFYYADVTDAETHEWTLMDVFGIFTGADEDGNGFRKFLMNIHPTINGHKIMANKVLSVLPKSVGGKSVLKIAGLVKTLFVFRLTSKLTNMVRNIVAKVFSSSVFA